MNCTSIVRKSTDCLGKCIKYKSQYSSRDEKNAEYDHIVGCFFYLIDTYRYIPNLPFQLIYFGRYIFYVSEVC